MAGGKGCGAGAVDGSPRGWLSNNLGWWVEIPATWTDVQINADPWWVKAAAKVRWRESVKQLPGCKLPGTHDEDSQPSYL